MTPLQSLLNTYRRISQSEREKGTYFEELIRTYFRYEAGYADLYKQVWLYSDWAREQGLDARDTGIDLVAQTAGTDEYHAIQCKFYDQSYRLKKADIDSFFTASGQRPFTHRIIVSTTNHWSENAELALEGQQPPVTKIDLHDLELSQIDWSQYQPNIEPVLRKKYDLKPHQDRALNDVMKGLAQADRGKLIMACGTGKTFTSLKIAEEMAGKGGKVLFLVPSLSLLSQTLTEWTQQSKTPLHSFAVCSDNEVGKKKRNTDDAVQTLVHELRYPATTDADRLAQEFSKRHDEHHMSVVFSTYHSIEVISEAQIVHDMAEFDMIICDEAHRTTGATFEDESESAFIKVHDKYFIKGSKRLYMTATPRIYGDVAKAKEEKGEVTLCSMDDPTLYGETLHVITFSEAVGLDLLTDYKVIVLTIDEAHISARLQNLLKDENNQLKVDDAARIIGCWKALSKEGIADDLGDDDPMHRAVAFAQVIDPKPGARVHKVSSKQIAELFQEVVEEYQAQEGIEDGLICEARHVDGSMNASEKEAQLSWLKEGAEGETCRILSNVRCLSEGVDVPSLDAVLFLTPRNSQVDVVQSVGRVMRKAPGKKRGYVVLPVVIPPGMQPEEALNNNRIYKVVWDVLQALRSHDDRFDSMINKMDLAGNTGGKMEVIAISDNIKKKPPRSVKKTRDPFSLSGTGGMSAAERTPAYQHELQFNVGELEKALYAKLVKKCGNRYYWDEWAKDIAKIAQTHITRITTILEDPKNIKEQEAFNAFAEELRDDLNDSITDAEVIEMLAQHLITKPVFDALFADYSFASHNPVSKAMQKVLDVLHEHRLDKEADTLDKFYESVQMRAEGIDNAQGKQKIVVELYDKFFRNAFPRMTERLGIVYTPVEVVDFIIHSVNHLLKEEFRQTLGSPGIHILDPFTGTGTFITRLLQSGLISLEELPHKYANEIHANEIVLLAYYIAAINIEAVYYDLVGDGYKPFQGICLTDTFQLYEKDDLISQMMADNSDRRIRQKKLDIRVIMGNPPYSAGQKSANDNNQNIAYPDLDSHIRDTYAKHSSATNKNALYDSYIRAIRWASDRVGDCGIIGFVSGSAWIERPFADGMRKSLSKEFTNIYVFHLRGDIRKNMLSQGAAKEGENIFGSGSMTGIAISLFVKNPSSPSHGNIFYHDIGDNLKENEKLEKIAAFSSIEGISNSDGWSAITPDKYNDWINQRDDSFSYFIKLGDKKDKTCRTIFETYSNGIKTNSDAWCYNFSKSTLNSNISSMIDVFNSESKRYQLSDKSVNIKDFVTTDPQKISWHSSSLPKAAKGITTNFRTDGANRSIYRPFAKTWLYYDSLINQRVALMPRIFPVPDIENLVIILSGVGAQNQFSTLISSNIPDLHSIQTGQCFPLYIYEKQNNSDDSLFADINTDNSDYSRKDGISDTGLSHFQTAYPGEDINKEDLFYYIYGILHSPEYRTRYADNLTKELPRIPAVKGFDRFEAYSKAGRDLAVLHLNYETVEPFQVELDTGDLNLKSMTADQLRVVKMKFPKVRNAEGKSVADKSSVIYNERITISGIPLEAYDYVVNGKPALEWVMERQAVTTDKASGIVNDANLWATETMGDPRYPLELFMRVITVSLETMKIVNGLPELDID